jgi:ribonucleoside-diphosphate reductase beta chain
MIKSFNPRQIDFTKEFMFFGEQPNVARYDIQRYPVFEKLIEKQLGFFWNPEEINVSKDIIDYKLLTPHEKHIFTENLKYQTFLDSTQSRAVSLALLPFVSLPELETLVETWTWNETLHSRSYSYILRNILSNPAILFDNIINNDNIMSRALSICGYYDDFINYGMIYNVLGEGKHIVKGKEYNITLRELKRKLLLCVASINILEGVRFYVSFACSFAFAENDTMEGNAKIISLIARDENLHLAITQNILKKWASGEDDPEMVGLFNEEMETIKQMCLLSVEQEKAWSTYLFKDGSMMGLNENILNEYIEYIAGKRMRAIGIKNNFSKKNPLGWTDKYLNSSDNQTSPQQTQITAYVIGGTVHDIDANTFSDIKF